MQNLAAALDKPFFKAVAHAARCYACRRKESIGLAAICKPCRPWTRWNILLHLRRVQVWPAKKAPPETAERFCVMVIPVSMLASFVCGFQHICK
ncbi:MAG: hypothetical protein J6I40_08470 [Mailhella sp.]|nr:hypothetical protein [Mailhella sp.]